ncbi:hypothetical protein B0T25DRAFT_612714 [Lasiosphaeria hispida]|uniref:F-box domain-containing protein n=1 Tax=Lasiosphaeria hispida TaxID=260671 RepID=A0AAJ0HB21_9PEZI|nr:hypothetical protein B0T25DRAFT_612714 [Lasiosphaeria hispida]
METLLIPTRPTPLANIPAELMLLCVEDLSTSDVLKVAKTCRSLAHLLLPVLYQRDRRFDQRHAIAHGVSTILLGTLRRVVAADPRVSFEVLLPLGTMAGPSGVSAVSPPFGAGRDPEPLVLAATRRDAMMAEFILRRGNGNPDMVSHPATATRGQTPMSAALRTALHRQGGACAKAVVMLLIKAFRARTDMATPNPTGHLELPVQLVLMAGAHQCQVHDDNGCVLDMVMALAGQADFSLAGIPADHLTSLIRNIRGDNLGELCYYGLMMAHGSPLPQL